MEVQTTHQPEGQTAPAATQQGGEARLRATMEQLSSRAKYELEQARKGQGQSKSHTQRYVEALEYQNRQLLAEWKEQYPEDISELAYSEGISVEIPRTPERVPHTATIGGMPILVSEDTARLISFERVLGSMLVDLGEELERLGYKKEDKRLTEISWDIHDLLATAIGQRVLDDTCGHEEQGYILI